jgi:hypothetical protein
MPMGPPTSCSTGSALTWRRTSPGSGRGVRRSHPRPADARQADGGGPQRSQVGQRVLSLREARRARKHRGGRPRRGASPGRPRRCRPRAHRTRSLRPSGRAAQADPGAALLPMINEAAIALGEGIVRTPVDVRSGDGPRHGLSALPRGAPAVRGLARDGEPRRAAEILGPAARPLASRPAGFLKDLARRHGNFHPGQYLKAGSTVRSEKAILEMSKHRPIERSPPR